MPGYFGDDQSQPRGLTDLVWRRRPAQNSTPSFRHTPLSLSMGPNPPPSVVHRGPPWTVRARSSSTSLGQRTASGARRLESHNQPTTTFVGMRWCASAAVSRGKADQPHHPLSALACHETTSGFPQRTVIGHLSSLTSNHSRGLRGVTNEASNFLGGSCRIGVHRQQQSEEAKYLFFPMRSRWEACCETMPRGTFRGGDVLPMPRKCPRQ